MMSCKKGGLKQYVVVVLHYKDKQDNVDAKHQIGRQIIFSFLME